MDGTRGTVVLPPLAHVGSEKNPRISPSVVRQGFESAPRADGEIWPNLVSSVSPCAGQTARLIRGECLAALYSRYETCRGWAVRWDGV